MKNKSSATHLPLQGKMYGATTMGARGQVVIPAQARKDLRLKAGDQLLVMGRFDKVLGLVKASELEGFINQLMEHIDGTEAKTRAKKNLSTFFRSAQ